MARCAACSENIILNGSGPETLREWTSLEEMATLAQSGCDLCLLFLRSIPRKGRVLPPKDTPIVLRDNAFSGSSVSYTGYLGLEMETLWFTMIDIILQPPQLRLDININEQEALVQAKKLLDDCLTSHNDCRATYIEADAPNHPHLPRRLLDVSHGGTILVIDVRDHVRDGRATFAEVSRYVCLSYRWGVAVHDSMLSAPFSGHISLELNCMPQTYKDAIATTRALGFSFLWIDALCIIQPSASGNDEDWIIEGPRMGSTYRNAECTIAATCAESVDDGFLLNTGRDLIIVEPCEIPLRIPGMEFQSVYVAYSPVLYYSVTGSSLNKRGWVQQERALSRRLLHFTTEGIFWECDQTASHTHYGDVEQDFSRIRLLKAAEEKQTLEQVAWYDFITQYSRSDFTNSEDRLIALSSLARALQPLFPQSKYFAGLWSEDLVRSLLWYCDRAPTALDKIRLPIAPSWSWASLLRPISYRYGYEEQYVELVEVLDVQLSQGQAENAYGNLTQGKLMLRGQLSSRELPTPNYKESGEFRYEVCWEESQDTSQVERVYTILPLAAGALSEHSNVYYKGIVIEPLARSPEDMLKSQGDVTYRRVGWIQYMYDENWKTWKMKRRKHWRKIQQRLTTVVLV